MKKLLLTLACAAAVGVAAQAAETTLAVKDYVSSPSTTQSDFTGFTAGDFEFVCAKGEESQTAPAYNKAGEVRLYALNTLTVNCTAPMTKIVFNLSAQGLKRLAPVTASVGTIATQAAGDTEVVWTGDASTVTFTVGAYADYGTEAGKSGQFDFDKVTITADAQGGEPIPVPEYASLAAWIEALPASNATVTAPVTAVYQNGNNLYIKEGDAWMLVYGALGKTYNNGDVIPAGITGYYQDYNGQPEFMPDASTFGVATAGTPVSPALKTVNEVTLDLLCQYVRIEGVTIEGSAENAREFLAYDDTNEIVVWNKFNIEVETGTEATVYGLVGINEGEVQLYPTQVVVEGEPIEPDQPDVPEPVSGIVFDYTNPSSLSPAQETPEAGAGTEIADVVFTCGDVTMTTTCGTNTGSAKPRIYNSNGTLTFRVYGDNVSTFASSGSNIIKIELDAAYTMPGAITVETGEMSEDGLVWTGDAATVEFTWHKYASGNSSYNPQVKSFTVTLASAGLDTLEAADATAPVEFFSLQGIRVANPLAGNVYIRRQGSSVAKVIF